MNSKIQALQKAQSNYDKPENVDWFQDIFCYFLKKVKEEAVPPTESPEARKYFDLRYHKQEILKDHRYENLFEHSHQLNSKNQDNKEVEYYDEVKTIHYEIMNIQYNIEEIKNKIHINDEVNDNNEDEIVQIKNEIELIEVKIDERSVFINDIDDIKFDIKCIEGKIKCIKDDIVYINKILDNNVQKIDLGIRRLYSSEIQKFIEMQVEEMKELLKFDESYHGYFIRSQLNHLYTFLLLLFEENNKNLSFNDLKMHIQMMKSFQYRDFLDTRKKHREFDGYIDGIQSFNDECLDA